MPENVNVQTTKMLHAQCAEVHGRGPKNAVREFTVTLTRRGEVLDGYLHVPDYLSGYLRAEEIPDSVKEAAVRAWNTR